MEFFSYLFLDLMQSDAKEIHYLLQSRLEIGNTHVLNYFKEFDDELNCVKRHGLDFCFLLGNG